MASARSHPPSFLLLVAAAVSGLVAAVVTQSFVGSGEEPDFRPERPVDLSRVLERLDALDRKVGVLQAHAVEASRARVPEGSSESESVPTPVEASLQQLAERMQLGLASALEVPRDVPVNWNELYRLASLEKVDSAAAERSVSLMTTPELVRRFGFPTKVSPGSDGVLCLSYLQTGPDGKDSGRVTFYVRDGYFAWYECRLE